MGDSVKGKVLLAASAMLAILATGAQASTTTVLNTDLGTVSPGSTTTNANGTTSTNPGGTLGGEAPAPNEWQQENVRGNGVVGITTDYARSGNGSIYFSTDGSGPSKADMEYYLSSPVLLSDFTGGSYDWYRDSASTINGAPAPSYRLMLTNVMVFNELGMMDNYDLAPTGLIKLVKLGFNAGLDHSGAVKLIVDAVAPLLQGLPPIAALAAVYFLGLVLTEFLSNNAVAVIFTPIAMQLAVSLGLDPRPFAVAVMFSASVAFATPIGYQTHMMVYGPGGYKFSDFLRLGLPLDVVTGIAAVLTIPLVWPLGG